MMDAHRGTGWSMKNSSDCLVGDDALLATKKERGTRLTSVMAALPFLGLLSACCLRSDQGKAYHLLPNVLVLDS